MDIFALLILARYISGKATPPVMPTLYGTLAFEGVEVSGLTRVVFYMEEPETISTAPPELLLQNQTAIAFDNTPAGQADEFWAFDATSGGNRWWKVALATGPITLTDGGNKTFPPHALSDTFESLAG